MNESGEKRGLMVYANGGSGTALRVVGARQDEAVVSWHSSDVERVMKRRIDDEMYG